ncbi:EF-P lysine aminoacylase GenX [Xanthobacter dioxanivorans]|uniref:EF-P lysine aminoacylase GenX n=1 Tax=Xanthobacter dioxanivorans TaxID=2528964 RepID=A0A974PRU1_9HYPH|nr:EF-P lysine aminoacylase EpmA [Xanthobacter dioxanivorans]QRG08567.1 EF-P lysine aminoacylase GenX [Xanthobacter dioxanivorans]
MVVSSSAPSPWWSPSIHADRRPFLLARSRITATVRAWFGADGFVEVETPALQLSPGNEAHLHAFATDLHAPDGSVHRLYLRTSPEFSAKKLLAAGEERIFEFARVFRDRERGMAHHPEFTLLEWYRAGAPYTRLMDDCARLLALAAEAGGVSPFSWRGRSCDPRAEPERITLVEAFARFAGMDLTRVLPAPGGASEPGPFAALAAHAGIRTAPDDTWADIFSRVLVERIEPNLGIGRPAILCDYPVSEAALARPKPDDPRFAERFELYACGLELANAFGELTDAREQRRRFEQEMAEKARLYGERYPLDEDFLAALAQMPQASGCALGFDRLAVLASGARRIEDVLWAPVAAP